MSSGSDVVRHTFCIITFPMKSVSFVLLFFISFACQANDLKMFCLSGPVDSICIVMNDAGLEWQTEYTFDTDGALIEIDGEEIDCKRDAEGRMTAITLIDTAEDDEESYTTISMRLFYDKAGHVVKSEAVSGDEQWVQTYVYDTKGLLKQHSYNMNGEDEIQTYTYLKFDKFGNWTERLEKSKSMDQTIRQIRNITYSE